MQEKRKWREEVKGEKKRSDEERPVRLGRKRRSLLR